MLSLLFASLDIVLVIKKFLVVVVLIIEIHVVIIVLVLAVAVAVAITIAIAIVIIFVSSRCSYYWRYGGVLRLLVSNASDCHL